MAKRTTYRSSKGTKLYAVRDAQGQFEDIQTYKRAHGADLKRKSAAEGKTAAKKSAAKKGAAKKGAAKKGGAKNSAAKKAKAAKKR